MQKNMQTTEEINTAPPPYECQAEGIYLPDTDLNAWPSSYYGRTRRIDLAKFYHDILKASTTADQAPFHDSSSEEEDDAYSIVSSNTRQPVMINKQIKKVTFSTEPPTVYEYEPEYDCEPRKGRAHLFDEGWPGRTKAAMKSTEFMDFKSKIEAQLRLVNDASLVSQLDKSNEAVDESSLLYNRGIYRDRKSPLVKKLNLRPIPNDDIMTSPSSSTSSTCDSPLLTPKDGQRDPFETSPGGGRWLNRTLSKLRSRSK